MNSYELIIKKLDQFIRKYYLNKLIRGGIYFVSAALGFYLTTILIEYFGNFNTTIRSLLFYGYIITNSIIFVFNVLLPLLKIYQLGSTISHQQAAKIIGNHFSEVSDKLINILQLKDQNYNDSTSKELIEASIEQKISLIKPIPFSSAIQLKQNKRYLKYFFIPALLLGLLFLFAPDIINSSTERLIKHDTFFKPQAPFQFKLLNKKLEVTQGGDFQLDLEIQGKEIPNEVFIVIGESQYRFEKLNTVKFKFDFNNLQSDIQFYLKADGYESELYRLKVLANPIVLNFQIKLEYPDYIGKKDEIVNNSGDLLVPEGTVAKWNFLTKDTRKLEMRFANLLFTIVPRENYAQLSRLLKVNEKYTIVTSNQYIRNNDSISYAINIIPDLYPEVHMQELVDSVNSKLIYFTGVIKDDYGFNKLIFVYKEISKDNSNTPPLSKSFTLFINKNILDQKFMYYFDFSRFNLEPGAEVEYYFEVWDNDGVNGSKSTKTQKRIFKIPSQEEVEKQNEEQNDKIKEEIEKNLKLAKELQKDIQKLDKNLIDKKNVEWEERKKLEDILQKQQQLQNNVMQLQKENELKNLKQNNNNQPNEKIVEKQKQLEELFEKIMTPEMKELFKQMQDLIEKMDKGKMQEMLDKMKLNNEDLEKELDRNLELFKQLELEQKLEQTVEKINELQQKQEKLSEDSKQMDNKEAKDAKLDSKQDELNKQFEDIKKDIQDLEKKNSELEEPNKVPETGNEQKQVDQNQQESSNQLKQGKPKKASEAQKKAAEGMQQISDKLQQMKQEMEEEESEEDINNLRQILENTLKISFEQEALMTDLKKIRTTDPRYLQMIQHQKKLKGDAKIVEDSLFALSKRVVQIQSIVNREINSIENNIDHSVEYLANREVSMATTRQQYAMTSLNNLTLLLSEALDQMQQQQMESKQKCNGGKCKKPGQSKPKSGGKMSAKNMRQLQENINKQIEEMKKGMQKNQKNGQGNREMSEKLAKLAAQQEALRNELNKLSQELKNDPQGNAKNLEKIAEEMEQTETDLVNKIISNETMKRQQEILTRLLEAEKAERERDTEEKRESKEADDKIYSNPFEKNQYNINKAKDSEILRSVPPSLNLYYKNKVNEYFNKLGEVDQ